MMKFKTTKKAILAGYCKVYSVSYCGIQYLLNYVSPVAYTTRVEGWGSDIYDFGNIAISTGYSPFGKTIDYDIVRYYDTQAGKIVNNYKLEHEERKNLVSELLNEFIAQLK